jgi:hypothetical protein
MNMRYLFRRLSHSPKARISVVALVALASSTSLAQTLKAVQDFRNLTVNNPTGMPIDAMDITGRDGTELAHLFILSKSMTFGNDQRPNKGAGAGRSH